MQGYVLNVSFLSGTFYTRCCRVLFTHFERYPAESVCQFCRCPVQDLCDVVLYKICMALSCTRLVWRSPVQDLHGVVLYTTCVMLSCIRLVWRSPVQNLCGVLLYTTCVALSCIRLVWRSPVQDLHGVVLHSTCMAFSCRRFVPLVACSRRCLVACVHWPLLWAVCASFGIVKQAQRDSRRES